MNEKMKLVEEKSYKSFQLPDGRVVDVYSVRKDMNGQLESVLFMPFLNDDECQKVFNTLVSRCMVEGVYFFEKSYEIRVPIADNVGFYLTVGDVENIKKEFKENGFDVLKKAIVHNYDAWQRGYKSGYRDETKKYHLATFSDEKCLTFRVTKLHTLCDDWQRTYKYL